MNCWSEILVTTGPVLLVLLRLGLQLILLWLEEVLNNGINQLIQLLLEVCYITVTERRRENIRMKVK